jgi:hypothetical protein
MYRSHAGVMGPVSLLAGCQQKLVFSPLPHYVVREKLGMDPQIRQPLSCGCVGSPSSRGQWICTNLLTTSQKIAMR